MSDHEFEKQVQHKMSELKLRPSDTVWMEVEKNIRHNKRRRRFWGLWAAALFICLSSSGYILYRYIYEPGQTSIAKTNTPASETTSTHSNNSTHSSRSANTVQTAPVTVTNPAAKAPEQQPAQQNAATTTQPAAASSVIAKQTDEPNPSAAPLPHDAPAETATAHQPGRQTNEPQQNNAGATSLFTYRKNKQTTIAGVYNRKTKTGLKNRKVPYNNIMRGNNPVMQESVVQPNALVATENDLVIAMPATVNEGNSIATDRTIHLPLTTTLGNTNTVAALPVERKHTSRWHWGIQTDAGYSRLAQSKLFQLKGLLGQDKFLPADVAPRNSSTSSNITAAGSLLNYAQSTVAKPSPIQPDFSFSAGLFVEWSASRRFRLSAGLQYAYLSMHTDIGPKVDTAITVNEGTSFEKWVPGYYKTAGSYAPATPSSWALQNLGPVTQSYKYRFQFIEMPVMMHWQMNKGRRLPPIVFDGGLSVSQMISVDALHYEGQKGIYYNDDSLFNKTQLSLITGVSVGLFQRSKHPLWVGPDLRYALSGLVKKEFSTGQYLWSAGIKIKMLLGRL